MTEFDRHEKVPAKYWLETKNPERKLEICGKTKKNWIGVSVDAPLDADSWMKDNGLTSDGKVANHLTFLFGNQPEHWPKLEELVKSADLRAGDVVFKRETYRVRPSHDLAHEFWCVDLDTTKSPKVVALQQQLEQAVPTPGQTSDHKIHLHLTICKQKRTASHDTKKSNN